MPIKSGMKKWKFHSRLTALQNRKLDNGLITTLCTYIPRGKKYPYNSVKRGWFDDADPFFYAGKRNPI